MEKPQEPKLVSTWESLIKNADKEAEIHTLHKYEYPEELAPESQFLSQSAPVELKKSRMRKVRRENELVADVPDIHYGFRKIDNLLIPTHQPEVMDGFLQVVRDKQPDTIILGGDLLDAPQIGKFEMDSDHFRDTLQLSIDGIYKYLCRLREDNPNAKIINLRGNHDSRFEKTLLRHAEPLFGVKRASMPDRINSLPFLLRFDELEIENVDAYRLSDKLITEHGELSVNGASTAHRYLARRAMSLMFHHTHRRESARRVFPDGTALEAFSFGCQADTTGSVPANGNKVNEKGQVVERFMNWNNGGGFVELSRNGKFKGYSVPIEYPDYETEYQGKAYKAREEVVSALKSGH